MLPCAESKSSTLSRRKGKAQIKLSWDYKGRRQGEEEKKKEAEGLSKNEDNAGELHTSAQPALPSPLMGAGVCPVAEKKMLHSQCIGDFPKMRRL